MLHPNRFVIKDRKDMRLTTKKQNPEDFTEKRGERIPRLMGWRNMRELYFDLL
jgi:hypothetical protein